VIVPLLINADQLLAPYLAGYPCRKIVLFLTAKLIPLL